LIREVSRHRDRAGLRAFLFMPDYSSKSRQSFLLRTIGAASGVAVTVRWRLDFSMVWKNKIPILRFLESFYSND
jgi:hypothetical protein